MNDIINWVALNNTLMIRIGFSAVVLLLVVYAFRFFFMPSASVIPSEASSKDKESGDMHIEELAELQGEIDTLRAKLKELQNSEQKAPAATVAGAATSTAGTEGASATVSAAPTTTEKPSVNEGAANELNEKLKTLEARLAEYEIIAEEIAEIGNLRLENQKLKEMLAAGPAVSKPAQVAEVPVPVAPAEEAAEGDSEIDALLGAVDEKTTADGGSPLATADAEEAVGIGGVSVDADESLTVSSAVDVVPEKELFIIQSEVEVTEEEKELINSFEQFKKV